MLHVRIVTMQILKKLHKGMSYVAFTVHLNRSYTAKVTLTIATFIFFQYKISNFL